MGIKALENIQLVFQVQKDTFTVYWALDKTEGVRYLFEGFQYGSVRMRCFQIS